MNSRISRKERGFTLVELVVVIAILGVLAAIAVPLVTNYLGGAKERAWTADRDRIQAAVDAYYSAPNNVRFLGQRQYPIKGFDATTGGLNVWGATDGGTGASPENPFKGTSGGDPKWRDNGDGVRNEESLNLEANSLTPGAPSTTSGVITFATTSGWYVTKVNRQGTDYAVDTRNYLIDFTKLTTPAARPNAVLNLANGHYYEAVLVPDISWPAARAAAAALTHLGVYGHLATITSAAENQFIVTSVPGAAPSDTFGRWLGGFQPPGSTEPAGGWQWITGEPFIYTAWQPGEPNNTPGSENALHLFGQGTSGWNDVAEGNTLIDGYVVEYEPPFATTSFLNTAPKSASTDNPGGSASGSYSWYVDDKGKVNSLYVHFPTNGQTAKPDGTAGATTNNGTDNRLFVSGVYP